MPVAPKDFVVLPACIQGMLAFTSASGIFVVSSKLPSVALSGLRHVPALDGGNSSADDEFAAHRNATFFGVHDAKRVPITFFDEALCARARGLRALPCRPWPGHHLPLSRRVLTPACRYPFSKADVASLLPAVGADSAVNGPGWYLQQLYKLCAGQVLPIQTDYYLAMDADVAFAAPVSIAAPCDTPHPHLHGSGAQRYCYSYTYEYNPPYFEHISCLTNGNVRRLDNRSGVAHHVTMSMHVLRHMCARLASGGALRTARRRSAEGLPVLSPCGTGTRAPSGCTPARPSGRPRLAACRARTGCSHPRCTRI